FSNPYGSSANGWHQILPDQEICKIILLQIKALTSETNKVCAQSRPQKVRLLNYPTDTAMLNYPVRAFLHPA
ncbi:MAG TPA: hypothetical protein VNV85_10480, partial [Puia sp.]|nr:hypothetical protein [Puia sp.]